MSEDYDFRNEDVVYFYIFNILDCFSNYCSSCCGKSECLLIHGLANKWEVIHNIN